MPKFVDDLDVAGAMKARAEAGKTTQTLNAAPGQVEPISAWVNDLGVTVATVSVDGVVDAAGLTVNGAPPVAAPVQLNAAGDAVIPVDNADSWIVGSDRMDRDAADATKNTRAFFNKVKGAFRAGVVNTNEWDDANVGSYSAATGAQTKASGFAAHAQNQLTVASGSASHAEGYQTTASGTNSHAEGNSTTASGTNSHAEGNSTTASGTNSHAEGSNTAASGNAAHAEGLSTSASGAQAHAEGKGGSAYGNYGHAQGHFASASREGQHSQAGGCFAVAGDAQACSMVLFRQTTDASATVLAAAGANGAATAPGVGQSTNVLTLAASRAFQLKISTVARRTDVQGEMAGWTWEGLVGRDSTGSARIIGTPIQAAWGDAAADPWGVAVSIDTTDATNNYVAVTATGQTGKTIRWVAKMEWVEVGG